jgi:hypothetical protein
MSLQVQFISLEEDDKDLILSFAIDNKEMGIQSLILHRTLFFEELLDEEERGVKVSLENDYFEQEDFNTLTSIKISNQGILIKSKFREYELDLSRISKSEIEEILKLLRKQNYDNRFTIHIA